MRIADNQRIIVGSAASLVECSASSDHDRESKLEINITLKKKEQGSEGVAKEESEKVTVSLQKADLMKV